jgi:hypothetical protein
VPEPQRALTRALAEVNEALRLAQFNINPQLAINRVLRAISEAMRNRTPAGSA